MAKEFNEYNKTEIETIANKFTNGEFVTHEELDTWYGYRKALQRTLHDKKTWEKRVAENDGRMPKFLEDIFTQAETEMAWVKTIKTFPLKPFCEYYLKAHAHLENNRLSIIMAERIVDGVTETEEQLIAGLFEDSDCLKSINNYRDLTTPVDLRAWHKSYRPATSYHPQTADDATELYDGRTHYVYVESVCNEARWGETYWVSVDCYNCLESLPVIKAFNEFDFKVGGFYKITCTETVYYGGNKKKYIMDIQEINEEEFLTQGLNQFATRW